MAKWNILLSCILRYTVNIHIVQGKKQTNKYGHFYYLSRAFMWPRLNTTNN